VLWSAGHGAGATSPSRAQAVGDLGRRRADDIFGDGVDIAARLESTYANRQRGGRGLLERVLISPLRSQARIRSAVSPIAAQ